MEMCHTSAGREKYTMENEKNQQEMTQQIDPKLVAVFNKLKDTEELYIIMSGCTKAPYVVCDEETFDDEILMYLNSEAAQEKAKALLAERIPVGIAKINKQSLLYFCSTLFTMGVNAMVVGDGETEDCIQVGDFVKRKDPNTLEEGKVWVENPELHLTALYYMQELRRMERPVMTEQMMEWQEEISVNFSRGKFLIAIPQEEKGIPLVKSKTGDVFQPIFTDAMEFEKFNREKQFRAIVVEAAKLAQILPAEAQGVILNPLGVNMPLNVKRNAPAGTNAAAPVNNAE